MKSSTDPRKRKKEMNRSVEVREILTSTFSYCGAVNIYRVFLNEKLVATYIMESDAKEKAKSLIG